MLKKDIKSNAPMLLAIFFAVFLATIGTSTVNIALPVLMKEFNTDLNTINWTLTGFMLAAGVVAPLTGFLGQKFSDNTVCFYSIIGLITSSLLCAFAFNSGSLIFFRVLQGGFSGLIAPATMTVIYKNITKDKQPFAISLWGVAAMLAPAFGPTLSGWLIENFGWRAVFLINIPIGIIAAVLIKYFIPRSKMEGTMGFDSIGAITSIGASLLLLVAFSESSKWGWSSIKTIGMIVVGGAILAVFIWRELKFKSPMLNLSVFKYTRYTLSIIVSSIITIALYSGALLTPLFLQNVQQETVLNAGLILLPSSLVMALIMPLIGKLYNSVGPRVLILTGVFLIAFGSWKMGHLKIDTPISYTILWMIVRSLGIALSSVPATNAGMEVIPMEVSGHASTVSNWIRQGLSSLSMGVFASMLTGRTASHARNLAALNPDDKSIPLMSITMSINDIYIISSIIILIAFPVSFYLKKGVKGKNTV